AAVLAPGLHFSAVFETEGQRKDWWAWNPHGAFLLVLVVWFLMFLREIWIDRVGRESSANEERALELRATNQINSDLRGNIEALQCEVTKAREQPVPATARRLRMFHTEYAGTRLNGASALVALFDGAMEFNGITALNNIGQGVGWAHSLRDLEFHIRK